MYIRGLTVTKRRIKDKLEVVVLELDNLLMKKQYRCGGWISREQPGRKHDDVKRVWNDDELRYANGNSSYI